MPKGMYAPSPGSLQNGLPRTRNMDGACIKMRDGSRRQCLQDFSDDLTLCGCSAGSAVDLEKGCNFEKRLAHDGTVRYLVDIGQDVEGVHVGLVWEDAHWERQGKASGSHTCFRTGGSLGRL
jgi:hypothetical protein